MIKILTTLILILVAPNLAFSRSLQLTQLTGGDENFIADVVQLGDGSKAVRTSGLVQIDQLFGTPADAVTWFYIGTPSDANGVGLAGDILTVTIAAAPTPLDVVYPAVSVQTTVTAGHLADPKPERALSLSMCADLDGDANFTVAWKCTVLKDYSGIFINSKLFNEWGERKGCIPLTNCFNVTATGTTTVTLAFNEIERRGLGTELQRSPNDPRLGVLGVSGSFIQQPGGVGDILYEVLENAGSSNMIVNGSVTPVDFRIECDPVVDKYIDTVRWYGACNGPKLDTFFCSNNALINGFLVSVRSESKDLTLLPLKNTNDFKNKFAFGSAGPGGQFRIDVQSGEDSFTSDLTFAAAAILKKCGTNGTVTDDYIQIKVRDDITGAGGGNLSEFEALIIGFKRTP